MGLFRKKKKVMEPKATEGFSLPEPPKLPEIPYDKNQPPKLPSYPTNSLGDKFSQNTIKEAISGKRGDEGEEDEFADEEMQRIPEPPLTQEMPKEYKEPVFVRLDKFEEAMNLLKEAKEKISDIEKDISRIKQVKEAEEKELQDWEKEIQAVKQQIEKIDTKVFSRLE